MPQNNLQANLILAGEIGETGRSVPPFQKGRNPQPGPWADMLGRIGDKNSRLYRKVTYREAGAGRHVVVELEKERSRTARELHAGAGQPLAGIILNLEMLSEFSTRMPVETRDILVRVQTLAEQALDQVRAVSRRLHPPEWQNLTTETALRVLVETGVPENRYEVDLDIDALPFEPSHFIKVGLYRCAQECISNMLRHARATRFGLSLRFAERDVELEVRDNGRGFSASGGTGGGIGITSLHEYARTLGGSCRISSGPEGTTVIIRVPLEKD